MISDTAAPTDGGKLYFNTRELSTGAKGANDVDPTIEPRNGRRHPASGLADELVGRSPSQGLEVLGEVGCVDEGQEMGLQAFQIVVVEDLDRGVLGRAVHPLGLAIGPGVIGLGQPVLDAVGDANAVEDVGAR